MSYKPNFAGEERVEKKEGLEEREWWWGREGGSWRGRELGRY